MENDEVLFAILAKDKECCLDYFLQCLYNQTYDKKKIHLYIKTNDNNDNTEKILLDYICKYGNLYASIYFNNMSIDPDLKLPENEGWNWKRFKILGKIRQDSINYAKDNKLHYFVADIDNFITPDTLGKMMKEKDKNVISPMLLSRTSYSNFHYDVDKNGYLKNDPRYFDLYCYRVKTITPVKVVHCTYFINYNVLDKICYDDNSYRHEYVIFSESLRKNNITQYLDNERFYGFLSLARTRQGINDHIKEITNKYSLELFFKV